jgi:hypothetical protein
MTVPGKWRKTSRSNPSGNCVEGRLNGVDTEVRDSKLGDDSPILLGFDAVVRTVSAGFNRR